MSGPKGPLGDAEARAGAIAAGAASFQVPMLITMFSAIAAGLLADTDSDLVALLGKAPRSSLAIIAARS